MPAHDTTPPRTIVFSGLVEKSPTSEMAISLVDEAGKQLNRAFVNKDGSCELSEEALASAHGVILEPINVLVEADQFRRLIDTEEPVDVTRLREAGSEAGSSPPHKWNHDMHHLPSRHPPPSGW
jgi:hypothetical protein